MVPTVTGFSSFFPRRDFSEPLAKSRDHFPPLVLVLSTLSHPTASAQVTIHPTRLRLTSGQSECPQGVRVHMRHRFPAYASARYTVKFQVQRGTVPTTEGPSPRRLFSVLGRLCSGRIYLLLVSLTVSFSADLCHLILGLVSAVFRDIFPASASTASRLHDFTRPPRLELLPACPLPRGAA